MVSPMVKTAVVGDNVEFKCIFFDMARWDFSGNTLLTNVATNYYKTNQETNSEIYNYLILKIFNVQPSNAGNYTCHYTLIYGVEVLGWWFCESLICIVL